MAKEEKKFDPTSYVYYMGKGSCPTCDGRVPKREQPRRLYLGPHIIAAGGSLPACRECRSFAGEPREVPGHEGSIAFADAEDAAIEEAANPKPIASPAEQQAKPADQQAK